MLLPGAVQRMTAAATGAGAELGVAENVTTPGTRDGAMEDRTSSSPSLSQPRSVSNLKSSPFGNFDDEPL